MYVWRPSWTTVRDKLVSFFELCPSVEACRVYRNFGTWAKDELNFDGLIMAKETKKQRNELFCFRSALSWSKSVTSWKLQWCRLKTDTSVCLVWSPLCYMISNADETKEEIYADLHSFYSSNEKSVFGTNTFIVQHQIVIVISLKVFSFPGLLKELQSSLFYK